MAMTGDRFIQLNARDGGSVSINPLLVRAVVPAQGGGSLIWYGHGHEVVVQEGPDVVTRRLGMESSAVRD